MTTLLVDETLDQALEELAAAMGTNKEESLRSAVREKLDRLRSPKRKAIDWDTIRQVQERIARMPVLDDRTPEDILGYNEHGTFD